MAIYKDKKTGKWSFRIYVNDPITGVRKQISRSGFSLKRDAIELEAKLALDYQNKKVELSELTMNELIKEYLMFQERRVKPTTYVNFIYLIDTHILPFFEKNIIKEIGRIQFETWYKYLDKLDVSNGYKNKILNRFKDILKYAEDQYDIRVRFLNTFPQFSLKNNIEEKTIEIYTEGDFLRFISSARNELESALFYTMFYTGARIGEIRALTWLDLNLDENYIRINKQVTTKIPGKGPTITTPKTNSSIRNIKIPNLLVAELIKWKDNRMKKSNFSIKWQVFGDEGFITENRIRRMVKNISDAAGVKYITLHGFRHSYTSLLYSKNVDPKIMQLQAGHSSLSVTLDIYTHLEEEKTKKTIINVLDNQEKTNK